MIVLDTNVVSEAMKPEPTPSVHDWLVNGGVKTGHGAEQKSATAAPA